MKRRLAITIAIAAAPCSGAWGAPGPDAWAQADDKARAIVRQLTLQEKTEQLLNTAPASSSALLPSPSAPTSTTSAGLAGVARPSRPLLLPLPVCPLLGPEPGRPA